jgi:GNAT superfamily N-acetyltransferase
VSAAAPLRIREIAEGESLRRFVDVAWRVNTRDPQWIAPLRMSVRTLLDRRKHPFHHHADVAYFVAERGGETVGRVAAVVNHIHNDFHGERTGFFGLFECDDDPQAAGTLLMAAADWLRRRGMERIRGPFNLSTNDEAGSPGVLIEGFDSAPTVMMSHNPPYYARLLEAAGFEKTKDLLAYLIEDQTPPERLVRGVERLTSRAGATIRGLDMRRLDEEISTIQDVYNSAWSRNWGFSPMTDDEFRFMAKDLRPIVDPELCLIAEVEGRAVGFSLALPDLNQALRKIPSGRLLPFGIVHLLHTRRKINGFRVLTLGFRPGYQHLGLGAALYLRTWQVGAAKGYVYGEASWILEDNQDMRRPLENMGARVYRTYRVYERAL